MSDEDLEDEEEMDDEGSAEKPGGKKKLIVIIVAIVVLVIVGAGVGAFFMGAFESLIGDGKNEEEVEH